MTWRPRYTSGNVTAAILGDPQPDRWERSERLRATLPEPRADERGDLEPVEPDDLAAAVRAGAVAVAEFYGLARGPEGWEYPRPQLIESTCLEPLTPNYPIPERRRRSGGTLRGI